VPYVLSKLVDFSLVILSGFEAAVQVSGVPHVLSKLLPQRFQAALSNILKRLIGMPHSFQAKQCKELRLSKLDVAAAVVLNAL
jgi:hypothetical protein